MSGANHMEKEVKVLGINPPSVFAKLGEIGAEKIFSGMTYIEGFERLLGGSHTNALRETPRTYEPVVAALRALSPHSESLISSGAYLRLRTEGPEHELILKVPDRDSGGRIKVEREISIPIEDKEWGQAASVLESIGFARIMRQQKFRVSYVYQPLGIRYDIDTWPGIPTYLEVEALSEEAIMVGLQLLDIDPARATSISGEELFKLYKVDPTNLFFENNNFRGSAGIVE